MSARIRVFALALMAVLVSGCFVVPVVVPPVRVQQNFGIAAGHLAPDRLRSLSDQQSAFTMTTRMGLHPMQLFPSLFERRLDLGVGYLIEATPTSPLADFWKHGPYLEFAYSWWMVPLDRSNTWFVRASTLVHADLLFANNLGNTIGFGGGGAVTIELVSFAAGAGAASTVNRNGDFSMFVGGLGGEWGGGLTAGVDYRMLDGASYGVFQVGLFMRWPAVAGIVIVSDTTDSNRSRSTEGGARPVGNGSGQRSGSVEVRSNASSDVQVRRPSVEVRGTN